MPLILKEVGAFRCFEGTFLFDTTNTGPGDYIIISPDTERVSVQLTSNGTAACVIEATVSTEAEIKANTATWVAWPTAAISGGSTVQDSTNGPVAAIRLNVSVALAGINAIVSVRTQRNNP